MIRRLLIVCALALFTACKSAPPEPDYNRPLPPGAPALIRVDDPAKWPDLKAAFLARDQGLLSAIDRSVEFFSRPSSAKSYPVAGISHERARDSLNAFRHVLVNSSSPEVFDKSIRLAFDAYMTYGWNGEGDVLFTGYYSPIFTASRNRTAEYRYPLYKAPADQIAFGTPTRQQIEQRHMLVGNELVWMRDQFEAYLVHVQGSAKLELTDGSVMYLGVAGTNNRKYTSIGRTLIAEGKLKPKELNLPSIRRFFLQNPDLLQTYLWRNERYVYFYAYDGANWPAGSLGVKVETLRSLAADKDLFPRGCVVIVATQTPGGAGMRPFNQIMLNQDTGGAINAPGRADIFMGVGLPAEQVAGLQVAEGKCFYFFLK